MTQTYIPTAGDQVRVRRYTVPCPELHDGPHRELSIEVTGTVLRVHNRILYLDPATVQVVADIQDDHAGLDQHGLDYTFLGQDPEHGCSWTLQTEVVPLAEAAQFDQERLDAQVALAEREHTWLLGAWERARDAEAAARQRLTQAQERLEAAARAAARHRADLDAATSDFDRRLACLSEQRAADREVMAAHVVGLARLHGLSTDVRPEQDGSRRIAVEVTGPHGLRVTVQFRGGGRRAEHDVWVLSWHGVQDGWRLDPAVFGGDVNPHHGHKATDVARGFASLAALLDRRFTRIEGGSAFVPASTLPDPSHLAS